MDKNKNIVVVVILCLLLTLNFTSLYHINLLKKKESDLTWELQNIKNNINNLQNNYQGSVRNNYQYEEHTSNEMMSPSELGKYLNIHPTDIYKLIEDKKYNLPYIKIDSEYKFSKTAINDWLTKKRLEFNTYK